MDAYKYIPMRLTVEERSLLRVLENALEVSEYTDNVDIFAGYRKKKSDRMIENLVDMMNITLGLLVASDLVAGEREMRGKQLADNIPFFRDLFEIGRRYKIMNPGKLRGHYGKMMWLLMDTQGYILKNALSDIVLDFVKPIVTVYSFLEERRMLSLLADPLLDAASVTLENIGGGKSAVDLDSEKEKKLNAFAELKVKYCGEEDSAGGLAATLSEDDLIRVVDSIADNNNYMAFNVGPVKQMLSILRQNFDPDDEFKVGDLSNLALKNRGGKSKKKYYSSSYLSSYLSGYSSSYMGGGAKLSHTHEEQYTFVEQSLTLWEEIMRCMPKLWTLADADMLNEPYQIADTGQGYHRLQQCPGVRYEMNAILRRVQSKFPRWVGLAVVHLGDRDVPNALVFIDKYTQVPNILAPITSAIARLDNVVSGDAAFGAYVSQEWGGLDQLKMQILADFFKHGFDGSGDDGGSCIDGRLTSAWNWCSKLEKKPFYYPFMFTGFQNFDGEGWD